MKKYQIFQISDNSVNGRYVKFSSYELVEDMGIKLSLDMYDKVYEGEVEECETIYDTLESIFVFLNIGKKPEDYRGHSLSVSDVILMDGVYYYVDGMGFQEVRMAKAAPAVYTVMIFNEHSMKRERKNFKSQEKADAFYENRKAKVTLASPEREKFFSYINEWGNRMMVQKMY